MRSNYTHISIVLDRSGSMGPIAAETITGFNTFLADQQAAPGEATLTLVQFDDQYEVLQDATPIKDIQPLTAATYRPRGYTALLDAIGRTVQATGARLADMPEDQRPAKVIFVTMTDGAENKSTEYTRTQINQMITEQREKYAWDFVFIGANQDAIAVAKDIGIQAQAALTYQADSQGVGAMYNSLSESTLKARSAPTRSFSWSTKDRERQAR